MFGFLTSNRASRKIANTEIGGATIDTCSVWDSARPYETAVAHPQYNEGSWIVVELYDTAEQANLGHQKWVKKFSGKRLPCHLTYKNETDIQDFAESIGHDLHGVYKRVGAVS